jgi:biofilm PGA synthesis N-glycosyltransferase PgaC
VPVDFPVNYLVITPVKDEERYVEHTLRSMVSQTVKPVCWIIVDDGSSDRTPEIIERYQADHPFIRLVRNPRGQPRQPGSAVIRAFNRGYEVAKDLEYDLIVKLDCDLSFEPDYFEKLVGKFSAEPKLGIASGVYFEAPDGAQWNEVSMPSYHACGASKVMRRECFEQIGGFLPARGWDTVDEIRAMARGWRTGHFRELRMKHWKLEGSGIGPWRTNLMHGEIYYLTGGSKLFFLLKLLHRLRSRPFLIGGVALFWGYVRTMFKQKQRLVTDVEARCYRALLNGRITGRLKALLP